jgi:hypothetical protein
LEAPTSAKQVGVLHWLTPLEKYLITVPGATCKIRLPEYYDAIDTGLGLTTAAAGSTAFPGFSMHTRRLSVKKFEKALNLAEIFSQGYNLGICS